MNEHSFTARKTAIAAVAVLAAGFGLAGCGNNGAPGAAGTSAPAGRTASAAAVKTAGSNSSGSGGSGSAVPVSSFFPVAVGNTWVYREDLGASPGEKGTATDKVIAVTPVAGGQRVTMAVTDSIPGLGAGPKTTTSTLIFHSDGSISVPLTQLGSAGMSVKSGAIIWPNAAGLASGQSRSDTIVLDVTQGGHTLTANMDVTAKGAGPATVTVPAGTYHATIVDQTMVEHLNGITINIELRTWVAPGVGPVKSVATTRYGSVSQPVSTEELESFTHA